MYTPEQKQEGAVILFGLLLIQLIVGGIVATILFCCPPAVAMFFAVLYVGRLLTKLENKLDEK